MRKCLIGLILSATCCGAAFAQDSVAKMNCLPGDSVSPWDTNEQCNSFVVDLQPFTSSWGNEFGIAPLLKSPKSASGFLTGLISAQSMSRLNAKGVQFPLNTDTTGDGINDASLFGYWDMAGFGINGDPVINDAPAVTANLTGKRGNQFGVVFADFGTTDSGASWNGVTAALVNFAPANPGRLYVTRVQAANNSCDPTSNLSQFGIGAIDEAGNVTFRADDFGVGAGCGLNPITGNNIFRVNIANRDCSQLNVISNGFPGGLFDAGATEWLVRNSATAHPVPNLVPAAMGGYAYLGSNFNDQLVRGPAFGSITADSTQLVGSATRGSVSYMSKVFAPIGGTRGTGAQLQKVASGDTDSIVVFGLSATLNVLNPTALTLPASVTDNDTGFMSSSIGVQGEFDHYHSQTAFRGGTSQISLNLDRSGNLLAAAEVSWPGPGNGGNNNPLNYIAVARVNSAGTVQWTMAGYNDGVGGKPIEDGMGNQIGQMAPLFSVTGGSPLGPSVSAPMIDAFGNVWFLTAAELFDPTGGPSDFDTVLVRAVYDEANFSYKLEKIFELGQVFTGQNSATPYRVNFLSIADGDSVNSSTAFSQNIAEVASAGRPVGSFGTAVPNDDPRSLGGLIINAEIVYDSDGDGMFDKCTGAGTGNDQSYNVVLYVGALATCPGDLNADGMVDLSDLGALFSDYGCTGIGCVGDLNGDGVVGLGDLGVIFGQYGQPCP